MAGSLDQLLADLAAWTEDGASYHADRELADRVLIACGWGCRPSSLFAGGVEWHFGRNFTFVSADGFQPHPVQRLDDALGQAPAYWRLEEILRRDDGLHRVILASPARQAMALGVHADYRLAACIAAVWAWSCVLAQADVSTADRELDS